MDKKYYIADISEHCAAEDETRKHLLKMFGEQCFIGCQPIDIGKCLVAVSSTTFDLANFRPDEILLDVRSSSKEEIMIMEFSSDEVMRKMLERVVNKRPSISVAVISGEDLARMIMSSKEVGMPDTVENREVLRSVFGKLGDLDED